MNPVTALAGSRIPRSGALCALLAALACPALADDLPCPCLGDVNHDCLVNQVDLGLLLAAFGSVEGDPHFNPDADFDGGGAIPQRALGPLLANWGGCRLPDQPRYEPGPTSRPPAAPTGCANPGGGAGGCGCATCGTSQIDGAMAVLGFNGEFAPSFADMSIPGQCMAFSLERRYRSRSGGDSVQGNRWDTSYNISIAVDPNDPNSPNLVLFDGNGRGDTYVRRTPNLWARNEFFRTLELNGDGSYTLHFPDSGAWNFLALDDADAPGMISSIVDRNGNTLSFAYDALGRMTTVTDALGRDVHYAYDGQGRLATVTDFDGRAVQYLYDADGNLASSTTPPVTGTPHGNDFPAGKTTTYTYTTGFSDERLNHQMLTITDPKGQTYLQNDYAHTIDPNDPRHTLDPDSVYFGRLVRQRLGGDGVIDFVHLVVPPSAGNGYATQRTIVNDRVGNVTEYFYDGLNRVVATRRYTGRWPADAPTFDTSNPPIPRLRGADPDYFETRYEYNADSLVVRVVHPNGNEDRYAYDSGNANRRSQGNLLEHCRLPGPLGGDQAQICEQYTYVEDLGGCCGANFVKTHTDPRGNVTTHDYDAAGNRAHTAHRIPSVVEDYEYNTAGQLTAHVLPDNGSGHRRRDERFYYDSGPQRGYLRETVVDAGGLALTTSYEYDALGRMVRMIDPRGHDALYEYNALDQLVRERSREPAPGVRYETLYYYDRNDNRVRVDVQNRDEGGALLPNTHFTTIYEYDVLNRLVRTAAESGEYSGAIPGRHDAPTADGLPPGEFIIQRYAYDANGNRVLSRSGESTAGSQPANTTVSSYDERNLLFRTTRGAGDPDDPNAPPDPGASTMQYDYDANGSQVRVLHGLEATPHLTQYEYDGYDRRVRAVDALGNVTQHHYDAGGNRLVERREGELVDGPGGVGNVRLAETVYTYDALDRVTRVDAAFFDPTTQAPIMDGAATTLTQYSDNSQVLAVTNDNNHTSFSVYDTANRLLATSDALGNTTVYFYDANANVLKTVETDRSDVGSPDQVLTTTYAYDGLDRRVQSVDSAGNTMQYFYDSRDHRTSAIDALAHEVRYFYDGAGRLVATVRDMNNGGADPNDPEDIVTRQAWDANSRLVAQIDDNGNATQYVYDALDRKVGEVYADGTAQAYAYDVHGNRVMSVDANGSVVACEYDALDRLVRKDVAPGPGVSSDTTVERYQYDGLSRLIRAEDDDSLVLRAYDSLSHVVSETLNAVPPTPDPNDPNTPVFDPNEHRVTTCVYDGVGNLLVCTYPGGRQIITTHDELERRKTIVDGLTGLIATYDYVGPGRVERREYGNGTRTEYTYDGLDGVPNPPGDFGVRQIVRTRHTRISDGLVIDDRTYTWDRMGNKTRRKDIRAGGPGYTHDYHYDAAYRLVRTIVTDPNNVVKRDEQYQLDGVGNRVQVVGGLNPGGYFMDPLLPEPADLQMNQYTSTAFDAREYDKNGNVVRVDFGLPTQRDIIYNYRNMMVTHLDAANDSAYRYDALGRRIEKRVDPVGPDPAVVTRFFLSGWQELEEQDELGTTLATYVYGLYIDEVLNMRR